MKSTSWFESLKPLLTSPIAIVIAAALIGILFARYIHDRVATQQKQSRPMVVISIINASLLALIFCGEAAFQKSGWPAAAATWIPQQVYLAPALILMIISMVMQNSAASGINMMAAGFVAWPLMGLHIAMPPSITSTPAARVMTMDVAAWPKGIEPVVNAIRLTRPTVFCLQNSGDDTAGAPLRDFERSLSSYHFVHEGGITVGSHSPASLIGTIDLPTDDTANQAIQVRVGGPPFPYTLIAVQMQPCDARRALHDPTGYFNTFAHSREDQLQAIVNKAKKVRTPLVICGDFNGPPRVDTARALTDIAPDMFEQIGLGYGYTSPTKFPVLRTDRILAGAGFAPRASWVSGAIGTDHLPVVADITFVQGR